jgi:hypothetical protein
VAVPDNQIPDRPPEPAVTTQRTARTRGGDSPVIEGFFVLGAILIVVGFLYSLARHWPSFDPLTLAMLVGIGFLLVVICERIRLLLQELRVLTSLMRASIADTDKEPPR